MIGASKILTVSYGTFSCTLEGFDEPFNTMKAIAEYFRDLAAEDRYFGAEPPTPDAAMLHRIAEREIQRRVEAKIQDNGVILRAGDAQAPATMAALAAPVAAAVPVDAVAPAFAGAADATEDQTVPVAESELAEIEAAAPAVSAPALADHIPDGVAAKLARIRQSVVAPPAAGRDPLPASVPATLPVADAEPFAPEHFEDEHAAEIATAGLPDFTDADTEAAFAAPEAGLPAADLMSDDDLADLALLDAAAPDTELAQDADDAPALPDVTLADVTLPDVTLPDNSMLDDTMLDDSMLDAIAATLNDAPAAEASAPQPAPQEFDDADMANLLATLQGDTGQDSLPEPAAAPVAAPATDLFADDADMEFTDDDFRMDPVAADEPVAALSVAALPVADAPAEVAADPVSPADAAPELAASLTAEPAPVSEKAQRARARVIKIRRADIAPLPVIDLTPEAEAALQAELAAAGLPAAAPVAAATAPDAPRKLDPAGEDAAVSRLLRQADTEMADGENRRRLSAIAHLKAAVAATVAERRLNQTPAPTEEQRADPYREDLARAVRPQRPRPAETPRPASERPISDRPISDRPITDRPITDRPITDRPAPLVLVSEQRIDRQPAEPAPEPAAAQALAGGNLPTGNMLVRPRRITGGTATLQTEMRTLTAERPNPLLQDHDDDEDDDTDNIFSDARGFAEFAERLGATRLPDLMEAAAAYVACVEKREHFSRPQLMRRIGALGAPGALSREDGLISFGTLLRSGRFAKVRRGQYMLAEDSDYLAEARRIAL